jgi:hypothetical protein
MAKRKITIDDEGLNDLINDALNGCIEDLQEAALNVDLYKTEVLNDKLGKERYSTQLNEALKIKGSARDRLIKLINLVKDRVKTKEFFEQQSSGVGNYSPELISKMIDEINDED